MLLKIKKNGFSIDYFVHHPNHDDTIAIGSGELLLRIIPCNHLNRFFVSLKRLIHA